MMEGNDEKRILLTESWDKEQAIIETRHFAAGVGFNKTDQVLIATAASELSSNILRYAGKGELLLKVVRNIGRIGIEMVAVDRGKGIADIEKAMQDHYSTTQGSLGLGLPSVRRIMDDFEIESSPVKGTRILARKWRAHEER
ncbi:MAG TPA: anti-sigma regulatory factor [Smithellaceae bacterium]|nr:anti-sigma regulatory factor [Smithellaceae bacterium]